jgi:hypothetical protein
VGHDEASIEFPTDDVSAADVVKFIDGVAQLFTDRLHNIKGIRSSFGFLEAIKAFDG